MDITQHFLYISAAYKQVAIHLRMTRHIITTLLITCCFQINSLGQADSSKCHQLKYGDFELLNTQDSIFVYRDFRSWYEINANKGFRSIYKIVWINDCNFKLVFEKTSASNEEVIPYHKGDTINLSATSTTNNKITFEANFKGEKKSLALAKTNINVFKLMGNRDKELISRKEETRAKIESMMALMPDSLRDSYKKYLDIGNLGGALFNKKQVTVIETIIEQIKNKDFDSIYKSGSQEFKASLTKDIFNDYGAYLAEFYGKIESYSVSKSPVSSKLTGFFSSQSWLDQESVVRNYEYQLTVKFSKVTTPCNLNITLRSIDSEDKLHSIYVTQDNYTTFNNLNKLSKPFFEDLKRKKYKRIYKGSSDLFKDETTYKQIKRLLNLINSIGHLDEYKLYNQGFAVEKREGFVQLIYVANTDDKEMTLRLSYLLRDSNWILSGLKFDM